MEGKAKSLCTLKISICDTLNWFGDRFRYGDSTMEPYARLKGRLRYKAADSALHLKVRQHHAFRAIPHLDPALHARLRSALLRPELNPNTRAKIEAVLNQSKNDEARDFRKLFERRSSPSLPNCRKAP